MNCCIISALPQELAPLVRDWDTTTLRLAQRTLTVHIHQQLQCAALAGGIGVQAAHLAAAAALQRFQPRTVISAGLAGALQEGWRVGTVVVPSEVISPEGTRYNTAFGVGALATARDVLSLAGKTALRRQTGARIVDMEAAGVAAAACAAGIPVLAVKAISDEYDFAMPPLSRFIRDGRFRTAAFLASAAFHPAWWPAISALRRNSTTAAATLCEVLWELLQLPEFSAEAAQSAGFQPVRNQGAAAPLI